MRKRAPKLWRRKKNGKYVGNFFVTVKGESVNLGTQDATRGLERRPFALNGTRNFQDDADGAAADVMAALAPAPDPVPPPVPPVPPAPVPPAPAPEPEAPPAQQEGWAAAVDAAADEEDEDDSGEGKPSAAENATAAAAEFTVTLDDVLRILKMPAGQLAPAAVELQLEGHKLIAGLAGYELAPVPQDHMARGVLAAGYEPVIKMLQMEDLKIHPGWFILAGSIALASVQLKGARKIAEQPKAGGVAAAS